MRKQINGLSAIVDLANMGQFTEPHLFVFTGLLDGYDVWKMRPFEEFNFSHVC